MPVEYVSSTLHAVLRRTNQSGSRELQLVQSKRDIECPPVEEYRFTAFRGGRKGEVKGIIFDVDGAALLTMPGGQPDLEREHEPNRQEGEGRKEIASIPLLSATLNSLRQKRHGCIRQMAHSLSCLHILCLCRSAVCLSPCLTLYEHG